MKTAQKTQTAETTKVATFAAVLGIAFGLSILVNFTIIGFQIAAVTQCNDGIDNDGDGLVDWNGTTSQGPDLGCIDGNDPDEGGRASMTLQNGWTVFEKSASTRIVYVSSSQGSDSNDGLSPQTPKKSLSAASSLMRDGFPDWMLLKRGDVWSGQTFGTWKKNGKGANEPMLFASYGSSLEKPLITYNGIAFGAPFQKPLSNIAIVGLRFKAHVKWLSYGANLYIEDIRVEEHQVSLQATGGRFSNATFRRNVVVDSFDTGGKAQGLFVTGIDGLLVHENVFDHNGWKQESGGRSAGGKTVYNHNVYISPFNTGVVVTGNISMRPSLHAFSMRSGGILKDNFMYRAPWPVNFGSLNGEQRDADFRKAGVFGEITNNVIMKSDNTDTLSGGGAYKIGNVNSKGVDVSGNIIAHDTSRPGNSYVFAFWLEEKDNTTQPPPQGFQNINIHDNIAYNWRRSLSAIVTGAIVDNVQIHDNIFQEMLQIGDKDTSHYDFQSNPVHPEITISKNVYDNAAGTDSSRWFRVSGSYRDFNWWKANEEPSASNVPVPFKDPNRSVESYHASLGRTATEAAFISAVRSQTKYNWRPEYMAYPINNYFRDGFNLSAVTPPPPPPPPSGPVCGNGIVESGEVCDGNNLSGQSCSTRGFDSGTLTCSNNCQSFNTSSCVSAGPATTRYWVGGSGNWSDSAHWSASSGGAGGASIPNASSDVFFNGSSGSGTITINQNAIVRNITQNSGQITININGRILECSLDCLFLNGSIDQGTSNSGILKAGRNLDTENANMKAGGHEGNMSVHLTGTGYWRYRIRSSGGTVSTHQPIIWNLLAAQPGQTTTLRPVGPLAPLGVDIDIENQMILGDATSRLVVDSREVSGATVVTLEIHSRSDKLDIVSNGTLIDITNIEHELNSGIGRIQNSVQFRNLNKFDVTGSFGAAPGSGPSWIMEGPLDIGGGTLSIEKTATFETGGHHLQAGDISVGGSSRGTGELHLKGGRADAAGIVSVGANAERLGRIYLEGGQIYAQKFVVESSPGFVRGDGLLEVNGSVGAGTNYYVSPQGSDSNSGQSQSAPFKTFGRAIQELRSGTNILFARGGQWNIAGSTVTISANGGRIGAYGSGNRPLVKMDAGATLNFGGDSWSIDDLRIEIGSVSEPGGVGGSGLISSLFFIASLEGRTNASQKDVTLGIYDQTTNQKETEFSEKTDTSGEITLPTTTSLESGTYSLLISAPGYLKKRFSNQLLTDGKIISLPTLLAGDFNGDNIVNSLDFSMMNAVWFALHALIDINGDGIVNSLDFSFLNKNWFLQGDT